MFYKAWFTCFSQNKIQSYMYRLICIPWDVSCINLCPFQWYHKYTCMQMTKPEVWHCNFPSIITNPIAKFTTDIIYVHMPKIDNFYYYNYQLEITKIYHMILSLFATDKVFQKAWVLLLLTSCTIPLLQKGNNRCICTYNIIIKWRWMMIESQTREIKGICTQERDRIIS